MQLILATATVVLFSCLITPVKASLVVNVASSLVENTIASSGSTTAKPIIVSKAEFGVFRTDKNGKVTFIPTTRVQLEEGNRYGWRIQLKNYQGEVKWREILRLPKRPESWGTDNGENFSISTNGTQGVTTRTQLTQDGMIRNSWTMVSGDPIGKHTVDIYINDRQIASFEFEVVPAKSQVDESSIPRI